MVSSAALALTFLIVTPTSAAQQDEPGTAGSAPSADVFAPVSDDARPVSADVDLVAFGDDTEASTAESFADGDAGAMVVTNEDLPELAVMGVTWEAGTAPQDLTVEFRTSDAQGWTGWEELERDGIEEAAGDSREGTEPHVLIDADQLQVRLVWQGSPGRTPEGAHVAVIDPGQSPADSAAVTDVSAGPSAQQAPDAAASAPEIHTRAQWGADESIRFWDPQDGEVRGLTIHHTAGVNGYSADEVPAIIRGIYHFHTEERGNGWGDIGYNVLIDRFGRAWEGRYGGVDEPIIGAHAAGMNAYMSGLSLMGNYEEVAVPQAAFDTLAQVGAWKLDLHGVNPHGSTTINGNSYDRINGHQDSAATLCPGQYMYSRMGEYRDLVQDYQD